MRGRSAGEAVGIPAKGSALGFALYLGVRIRVLGVWGLGFRVYMGVRSRGTLGDIDPLNKVLVKRAQVGFRRVPFKGPP